MAERIAAADQSGCAPIRTAAEPARCGVAIDVPWKNAHLLPGIELRTFTPGATTSGLTRKSTSVGPWLENPAMMLEFPVRKYCIVAPIVVGEPFAATSAARVARPTM